MREQILRILDQIGTKRDLVILTIFLSASGAPLLSLSPLLWVAWPIALVGIAYGRRSGAVPVLCFGVPLVVAVGYASLILSSLLMLLLIVIAGGSNLLFSKEARIPALLLVIGVVMIPVVLASGDPFFSSLVILALTLSGGGSLFLYEHTLHRRVRGGHV